MSTTVPVTGEFRHVPLSQLVLSPLNVRQTAANHGIAELAALIESQGVIQNLTIYEELESRRKHKTDVFAVVAGGRRWRALHLLRKQGRIDDEYPVPCNVVSYEQAREISLAENSGREPMHPADEFEAFRALIDEGQSIETVAARFGVTPQTVQRRLKLANVHSMFLDLYRRDEATLDQLMALAISDDPNQQKEVWESLGSHGRHPHAIRRALTQSEVRASAPLARFVGLKAYEKAGGAVRRDLFSEQDDVYLMDAELLTRLAREKLEKQAGKLRKDGHAWVDVTPQADYSVLAAYGRVQFIERALTEAERAELDALELRRAQINGEMDAAEDEADLARLEQEAEELEAKIEEIREACSVPDPEQATSGGAVVTIGQDGKLRVESGLLRPEDAQRFMVASKGQVDGELKATRTHSAALIKRLTAHRSLALQAMLTRHHQEALIALTHELVSQVFFMTCGETAMKVNVSQARLLHYGPDLKDCKASVALAEERAAVAALLPRESSELFAWLSGQPLEVVLRVLAFCVSTTVDVVQDAEGAGPGDELALAVRLNMRDWWTPTADGYLNSIPKERIAAALRDAEQTAASIQVGTLKKGAAAKLAEETLAQTSWLPSVLRSVAA